jgi:hypothetical protein
MRTLINLRRTTNSLVPCYRASVLPTRCLTAGPNPSCSLTFDRQGHPHQRGGAGTCLDAAQSGLLPQTQLLADLDSIRGCYSASSQPRQTTHHRMSAEDCANWRMKAWWVRYEKTHAHYRFKAAENRPEKDALRVARFLSYPKCHSNTKCSITLVIALLAMCCTLSKMALLRNWKRAEC